MPLRRSSVIADDVLMTPPLRSLRSPTDDVESSLLLSTPYESSSVDTMSCCRTLELPPTPKSTTHTFAQLMNSCSTVNIVDLKKKILCDRWMDPNMDSFGAMPLPQPQAKESHREETELTCRKKSVINCHAKYWVHDDGALAQTEEGRGSKADAADVFIMTKPVDRSTCISMPETRRSAWWLCSKDSAAAAAAAVSVTGGTRLNWLDKTCNYFKTQKAPPKVNNFYTKRQ